MGQATTTALTLIARQSGADTDMNVKDNRIRLQRVIYLAQAAGMPKIYTFRWFNNGPMSTRLSGDIEDMRYTNGDAPDNPTRQKTQKERARSSLNRKKRTHAAARPQGKAHGVGESRHLRYVHVRHRKLQADRGDMRHRGRRTRARRHAKAQNERNALRLKPPALHISGPAHNSNPHRLRINTATP